MTIKITSATFSACITSSAALPADDLPIVALVGRSNVGKSSLINSITGRKELARTSSLPGKTLTINFYCINEAFYIVDLPGYGYAKASKVTRAKIQSMMNEFFSECKNLKGVVQVLDIRHKPSPLDVQMHDWVREQKFNHFAVLTKVDKLSNQQALKMRSSISRDIKGTYNILFSAKSANGRDDFLDAVEKVIAGLEFKASEPRQRRAPQQDNRPKGRPPRNERPQTGDKPAPHGSGDSPAKKFDGEKSGGKPTERHNRQAQVKEAPANSESAQKTNQPHRENTPGTGAGNNRRRRWKNKRPGGEPRQDSPKNE